jgi:NAD(P)-dependent dehydrogenase (short-subunit alcohol dehydrogenase family)
VVSGITQFDLSGKIAVVTGAGRGLGRGYSQALAQAGAHVVCVDVNADDLERTVTEVQDAGGEASARALSVTDVAGFRRFTQDVASDHGHLDILVNNAGTEIPKDAADVTEADFDLIIGVNLRGTYFCAQSAAAVMVKQRSGKIINIGSLGSQIGLAGATVYCCSKGGVLQFTRALAIELAKSAVQVNAIGPGYFRTQMTEPFFQDPVHNAWIAERIPVGRVGTPEDLAGTVVFLASSASDYITGQIVYVDGGWLAS